jgi:hypothetical protein
LNIKAKRDLLWRLEYPTWRKGFRSGLVPAPPLVPAGAVSA